MPLRNPAQSSEGLIARRDGPDVLRWPLVGPFLKWRWARPVLQVPLFGIALFLVWQGLTGPDLATRNAATVLTWVHYRGVLVFALLVAGNLFCLGCPFMLPRAFARRLTQPVRQWPAALRNKWVAVALFVAVLFTYERFALWDSPALTAWVILAYFAGALAIDLAFAQAPFCKYVCPLGQFNFVASTLSPLELKVADPGICTTCATRDCINGTPRAHSDGRPRRGCELGLFQPQKRGNMDCTLCLDCVHACPHDNIALTTRLPASELWDDGRRSGIGVWSERPDLVVLVAVFTFGALLNAFAMTSPVGVLRAETARIFGTSSETGFLAGLFAVALVVEPVALLVAAAWTTRIAARVPTPTLSLVGRFSYALVPVGLGVWAAHYLFHLLVGFWTFIPVLQDTARRIGLSTAEPAWHVPSLAPELIVPLQQMLLFMGIVGSLIVAYRVAERESPGRTWSAFLPWGVLVLLLGVTAIWVLSQPMDMRGLMIM